MINLISLLLPLSLSDERTTCRSALLSRRRNCCDRTTRRSIRTTNTSHGARNQKRTAEVGADHQMEGELRKRLPRIQLKVARQRREAAVTKPCPLPHDPAPPPRRCSSATIIAVQRAAIKGSIPTTTTPGRLQIFQRRQPTLHPPHLRPSPRPLLPLHLRTRTICTDFLENPITTPITIKINNHFWAVQRLRQFPHRQHIHRPVSTRVSRQRHRPPRGISFRDKLPCLRRELMATHRTRTKCCSRSTNKRHRRVQ